MTIYTLSLTTFHCKTDVLTSSQVKELFAGFGRSDITPAADFPNGIWMAQKHLRATGIHRRLYVSCVILGADAEAVALLSYDLTILSAQQVVAIRAAVNCFGTLRRPSSEAHPLRS